MARTTKQQPATKRVTYSREGPVSELRGTKWDVPSTIRVENQGKWIESQYREQVAREAAEAEREQRNADVLRDRQSQVLERERLDQERSQVDAEIASIRGELQGLKGELSSPDMAALAQVNAQTVSAMGRTLDAHERVDTLLQRLEAAEGRIETLNAEAIEAREVSLKLVENYQQILNGVQETHGKQINEYRSRYVEAATEATKLSEQIGLNWEVVDNAARINETAISQATAASRELLERQHKEFLSSLTVVLGAIGVTQEQLDAELIRLDQAGYDRRVPILEPSLIAQMVQMTQKHQAAREDAERRTNAASATSAGKLEISGYVPVKKSDTRAGFTKG